ncbi:MAG TPA: response regulator [Chitinophagaceae bacterium]|nr:response regulator [Chitinophagaceae bacterium]
MSEIQILLVEDNEGDIILTLEAFKEIKVKNSIAVVKDGEEAIEFLKKQGQYADRTMPNLILLDINMPKLNGIEVLDFIKKDEKLRKIPVVMLTTSSSESDIAACYEKSANCFITKPLDFGKFLNVVEAIESFWFTIAQLPKTTS